MLKKQSNHSFGRRVFIRLVAAPHTSMLAAVDEYGVVYVISHGDYFGDGGNTNEELLPYFQHLGLGMLAGWEVGGSDISCQRVYHKFSGSHDSSFLSTNKKSLSVLHDGENNVYQSIENWNIHGKGRQYTPCLSGFSSGSERTTQTVHEAETKSLLMRRIFLPTYRVNQDDNICFSSFGITRLTREHNANGQNGCQIVHFDLFSESGICDDNCLSKSEMFLPNRRKEALVGDAVGCTFKGCFYLVTETGLSVVLPSVVVSSSFLPIESLAYRQWSTNSGLGYQVKDNLEMKGSKHPCPPWTLEVLDRVLLYESIEEAERLCFENGENSWWFMIFCLCLHGFYQIKNKNISSELFRVFLLDFYYYYFFLFFLVLLGLK